METKDKKSFIILISILGLIVIGAGVYFVLKNNTKDEPAIITKDSTGATKENVLDPDALLKLSLVNSLKLNKELFTDIDFLKLTDISVSVVSESKGRKNPFAPI